MTISPDAARLARPADFINADRLLSEEEKEIRDQVRTFVDREVIPKAADYWDRAEFPFELLPGLGELGRELPDHCARCPAEHRLATRGNYSANTKPPSRLVHIECAYGVDAERVLVGRNAVGRDAGEMDDSLGAGEGAEHLSQVLNVA